MLQHAAVVAAASEATRGLADERFVRPRGHRSDGNAADQDQPFRDQGELALLLIARSAAWITKKMQRCRRAAEQCHGWRKPSFCPVPRRTHHLPQGPLKQELQALRPTRRVDGVRVVGPSLFALSERCAPQRSPPVAAAARLETCAAALRRPRPRLRCLDVPVGVETR